MILISAMGRNRVIGSGNGMPWNIPEEFQQFRNFIRNQTIIAGRKSWDIFKEHLTSRHNIVVSRRQRQIEGATVVPSVEQGYAAAQSTGRTIYCIGGATIYSLCLPLATHLYISYIEGDYAGDAFFPAFDLHDWHVVKKEAHAQFEFVIYERKHLQSQTRGSR